MTKEEIISALLADKEMPYLLDWEARDVVDFVIENYKPSLPSNLDEAADKFAFLYDQGTCDGIAQDCFKAGAEWMAGQGYTKETQVYANRWTDTDEIIVNLGQGEYGFKAGDKVIVQIRKK